MKVIYGIKGLHIAPGRSVVTIGVFDGVHIGHVSVIKKAIARARSEGLESVIITFDPHPLKTIRKRPGAPSLISLDHRIRLLRALSPDYIVVLRFSKALARQSPSYFAREVLAHRAGAKEVYVGEDFYFGKGAKAGPGELRKLGRALGFGVEVVPYVKIGASRVSSSLIRGLIAGGDLKKAGKLLGRTVSVLGTVTSGANLARELGYPTANLNPHHEIIPPCGVYAVLVRYGDKMLKGVLNIGLRPTFYAPRDREPAIEVHIFNFHKTIYGRELEVIFVKKIRDERRFPDRERLIARIEEDEKAAVAILRNTGFRVKTS